MAVCGGGGLTPEDRAELLVILANDSDEQIKERAANALLTTPAESFILALKREDASPRLFGYCAENLMKHPGMADALAQNPRCPLDLLVRVAHQLSPASVQALCDSLERLSSSPLLVAALASNPALTTEQRALLHDIEDESGVDQAALAEAAAAAETDVAKRDTLIQRIGKMRVIDRIKLALTGNREERMTLIRDPNKLVQRAVLQSPKLTDQEVESFAGMTSLNEEVLRIIAGNRSFIKSYTIVKKLINNPKVPLDISLHLLPRLNPTDVKFLTMNKNIPETLRSTAAKLMRQRKMGVN
jgi:hypothetical protein